MKQRGFVTQIVGLLVFQESTHTTLLHVFSIVETCVSHFDEGMDSIPFLHETLHIMVRITVLWYKKTITWDMLLCQGENDHYRDICTAMR